MTEQGERRINQPPCDQAGEKQRRVGEGRQLEAGGANLPRARTVGVSPVKYEIFSTFFSCFFFFSNHVSDTYCWAERVFGALLNVYYFKLQEILF